MPKTHQEKFQLAFNKVVTGEYDESVGKAQFTKIVKAWLKEVDLSVVKRDIAGIILSIEPLEAIAWIYVRYVYIPGCYWLDNKYNDTVLGWYSEYQLQAEELPLRLTHQAHPEERKCTVLAWGTFWEKRGFACAEYLPCLPSSRQQATYSKYWEKRSYSPNDELPLVGCDWEVKISVEKLQFFAKLGYASPCKIQWERVEPPHATYSDGYLDGYYVRRSIIPHGFWCAWKWWEGARDWYYEHRPELFEDDEIWGDPEPIWHAPPDSTSAILGGKNRKLGEDLRFYIDGEG